MLDLLITNATLPDGRTGMSVAVQGGRIAAIGTHAELLKSSPLYARLAALQFDDHV